MRSPIHPEVNLQLREIEPGRFSCSLAVRTTGERCSSREFNMNKNSNAELGLRLIAVPLLIALAIGCLGCQTFSLTNEQWEKHDPGDRNRKMRLVSGKSNGSRLSGFLRLLRLFAAIQSYCSSVSYP
jgi:hypothetical protein